ncbi:Serpin B6 [Trichuris trichiura]|uniref:Serpin B6 n=1 Tax=Trichuris trichiura TaxID=36087 RepID=A0A077ZG26_TRITR|nr:Serpin B6 [Trichuris trichiura]
MSLDVSTADFALRTYHEAAVADRSFFISPFSILIALGMTYVGSSGNTKSQMKSKLFESSLGDQQINSLMSGVMKSLNYSNTKDGYELYIANRLFGQSELQVLPEFRKCIQEHYSADIELLDFTKSLEACKHINDWVEEKTKGKIKDLIPKGAINSLTRLILTNAIYFKADWKTPFKSELTKKTTFYVKQGEEKTVEMMQMDKEFPYSETDELQILGIPYVTEKLLMYFILPKERFGLKNVMTKLNAKKLLDLFDSTIVRKVEVHIPNFKLEHDLKLKQVLQRLGLTDMFDPGLANFSKITGKRDLFVSEAFHKAFIEVNEKGSEAAAATAVVMAVGRPLVPIIPPKFVADHPFLFAIVDRSNRIILFIDLIPKGAINSLTRLILTNAIYFKAGWKTPFKSELTKKTTFYVKQGEEKTVEMMQMDKEFAYSETDELQILGISYVTEKLLMYFVLPKERFGHKNMMRKLNATRLLDLFDSATERKVEQVLQSLGLTDMFDPGLANFSKITGKYESTSLKLFIKHSSNEAAAAATAVVMAVGSSLVRISPPKFTADHPFLFAIVDRSNGIILFIGDY